MAIEIIKQGQTKFTAHCYKCGCEFSYEMEDVIGAVVMCPCCGNYIVHTNSIGTIKYPSDAIPCSNPTSTKISTNDYVKKCEACDFYKKYLVGGEPYVGDSPCLWCKISPDIVTCYCTTSVVGTK